MSGKIQSSIKKYLPSFYDFLRKLHWFIQKFRATLFGTKSNEKMWAGQTLESLKKEMKDENGVNHPHRNLILNALGRYKPFKKLVEIGCGYGANLCLIKQKFPAAELLGLDINLVSIKEGHEWLKEKGVLDVELVQGRADDISNFAEKSFDIVLTDAVLIYIAPDKIEKLAKEMLRIARKALILVEWSCSSEEDPSGKGIFYRGCWKRNYPNLFKKFVSEEKIRTIKIPKEAWPSKNWEELGYITEIVPQ